MNKNNQLNIKSVLDNLKPSEFHGVDGKLEDGRVAIFKREVPDKLEQLVHLVVAIANHQGGFVIFGVNRKGGVIGLQDEYETIKERVSRAVKEQSLGVDFNLSKENEDGNSIVVLEIKRTESIAFFSNQKKTPQRRILYCFGDGSEKKSVVRKMDLNYKTVYKYMTLDAFFMSLYTGKWRFFEPSKWNDKYEQRFYCARYELNVDEKVTPQLFATCLTRQKNSEAAWKVYSQGQGMGTHCVQLEMDIVELRKQIERKDYKYEERLINYQNEKYILDLHKRTSPNYAKYFESFSLEKYLDLLSLKRDAYKYEEEVRLFVIPYESGQRHSHKNAIHLDIDIEWKNVIRKVRIDKKCTEAELNALKLFCHHAGIQPIINGEQNNDVKSKSQKEIKNIKFELFDIDNMPGAKVITIK